VVRRSPFLLLFLLLSGCAALSGERARLVLTDAEIHADTLWKGRILIDGSVKVFKGATLTILPGTEIAFVRKDLDRDGLGDGTLIVEGALRAVGTRSRPILFHSAAGDSRPGDWLEIRVDFSKDVQLRYCEFTDSAYTLHAHFTKGVMEDCTVRGNIDGCRLGQSSFVIRNCLIEQNQGKGINFRNAAVEVSHNIIRYNGSGIFLFESDRESRIHHNNLYGNAANFRLGDFFTGDVRLTDNWWGTADAAEAAETVHDRKRDPTIGTVHLAPSTAWVPGTGPRDVLQLREAWRFATGGFVDASPVASAGAVYVPSWDGRLYALDPSGALLWSRELGDVADAPVALDDEKAYCQSWGREVFALDRRDGAVRWRFNYAPSPADDHRQGGGLRVADLLLLPAWNGTLHALEADSGIGRWHYRAPQPLRAAPVPDGDRLYLSSGAGTLSALDLGGRLLWEASLGAPLLAPPAVTPNGPVTVNREGVVHALTREGAERWRLDLVETCYYGGPLYDRGALYLGTAGGHLWKLEAATGRVLWKLATSGPLYAAPLIVGDRLFFGDNGGTFYAVGAESGDVLATFEVPREIQGTPVLAGERLIFGSRDHNLYALDINESPGTQNP
jgi:outer membrane protein assembly factor BamB